MPYNSYTIYDDTVYTGQFLFYDDATILQSPLRLSIKSLLFKEEDMKEYPLFFWKEKCKPTISDLPF